jgi:hypothetical protein
MSAMTSSEPGTAGTLDAVRTCYLATARLAGDLIAHPAVHARWHAPSILDRMTVADLAAHLGRSVLQVEMFLDAADPASPAPVDAGAYYGVLTGLDDLDSDVNVGVRERSRAVSVEGPDGVTRLVRGCLDRLVGRLPDEPADRQVLAYGDNPMLLDEYLRTRLVEFCLHVEDLALSLEPGPGADPTDDVSDLPDDALAEAVAVLVAAARHRHGDAAVLRALGRRERDAVQALRVF